MEPPHAVQTAAILLGIGALAGLVMAGIRLKGAPRPPSSIAMLHGVLAAAGLTLLVYSWCTVGIAPMAKAATGILIIAALGGTYLNLRYHSQMQPLPVPLMIGHAAIAVVGFVILLFAIFPGSGT
jgi:hypothetical protein